MPCQSASLCGWRVAAPARLAPGFLGGRKSVHGVEREDPAGCSSGEPRRKPGRAGRTGTHLHTPQSRRARAGAAPAPRVVDSCCNWVLNLPEEPERGQRGRAPRTPRKARDGAGACGHGVRVAPGPREGACPSNAAGCWPHACSPPLLCSSLLSCRGVARRSWPRWLRDSSRNSPSGRRCLVRDSQLSVGPGC